MTDDKRLIEDYLPIEDISAEASSEPRTKGHISTLHLWRARRPLVACRAAVYGALTPMSQFLINGGTPTSDGNNGREAAKKFVKALCQYPGSPSAIEEATQQILRATLNGCRAILDAKSQSLTFSVGTLRVRECLICLLEAERFH